jgi:putative membrane protein
MQLFSKILILLVALEHFYFLYLEMFVWTSNGYKIVKGAPPDFFVKTKTMAANQGLYNGFLATGLIWSFFIDDINWSNNVAYFFLSCVAIAGIYGAYTVQKVIFLIQALPALLAILAVYFSL